MRCAQGLYERGFITYMRTDSVHLSDQAINASRNCVESLYGKEYLSKGPRQFSTKARNAQEAMKRFVHPAKASEPPVKPGWMAEILRFTS